MELGDNFGALIFASFDFEAVYSIALNWVGEGWQSFTSTINGIRLTLDPLVWVIGSLFALIPGTFAIYKWFYYRRSRLPQRFEEMLQEEEERLRTARTALVEKIQRPESIKPFKSPIFVVPSLSAALRKMKWIRWWEAGGLSKADESLRSALEEIDTRMRWWDDQRAHHLGQQATALLLRGAIAAARADRERVAGRDGNELNREALTHFLKAIEIDPADIEAVEYAAHQHRMLGEIDDAITLYERLAELTDRLGADNALVRTLALRYQGELYERKYDAAGVGANLGIAKQCLDLALEIMPNRARGGLLEAFTLRWSGSVEDKRLTAVLWRSRFDAALLIFQDLIIRGRDLNEAKAGLDEVKALLAAAIERRQEPPPPQILI